MKLPVCPLLLALAASGCSESSPDAGARDRSATPIRVGGSTTVNPLIERAAAEFPSLRPGVQILVSYSSTGHGIDKLIDGTLDVAGASRQPHDDEVEAAAAKGITLKTFHIGFDALAIIVHPSRYQRLESLSREELAAIFFSGTITEWSQLDPEFSGTIHVYGRDQDVSGSAEIFTEHIASREHEPFVRDMHYVQSTRLLVPSVAADVNGIAFAPFGFADDSVRVLGYRESNGTTSVPSVANVRDFSYPLRRDLFVITDGMPGGAVNEFIQFLFGPRGQALAAEVGLIGIR